MRDNHPPSDELTEVSWLEAESMIPNRPMIHTLKALDTIALGRAMNRNQVIDHIREYGAYRSGPNMTSLGHALVIQTPHGWVFIETL